MAVSRYVEHLLRDIRQAKANAPTEPDYSDLHPFRDFDDDLDEVERYVRNRSEDRKTIAEWTGLNPEAFPPVEKLTKEEQLEIVRALLDTFGAYNWCFEIPEEVPADFAYSLMLNQFSYPVDQVFFSRIIMDFCIGCAEECELKQYCSCLKYQDNSDADFEPWKDTVGEILEQTIPDLPSPKSDAHQMHIHIRLASEEDRAFIEQLLENYPGVISLRIEPLLGRDWEDDSLPF